MFMQGSMVFVPILFFILVYLLCYSCDDIDSLHKVADMWLEKKIENVPVILVGLKSDVYARNDGKERVNDDLVKKVSLSIEAETLL